MRHTRALWSAPAKRSGDSALDSTVAEIATFQSGVAASLYHRSPKRPRLLSCLLLYLLTAGAVRAAEEPPPVPVPASPYLPMIYRFADALIEHGRDVYGPEKTGLFLGTIERAAMTNRPPWTPDTTRGYDHGKKEHVMVNPQYDQNLLRLFYTLSELSGRPKYKDAANAELNWLLNSAPSNAVGLLTRHDSSWDVLADKMAANRKTLFFKPEPSWCGPWMLWEQCFAIDAEASARIATALLDQRPKAAGLREVGFYLRTFALAYRYTTNDHYLKALNEYVAATNREDNPVDALSLAIDAEGAAHHVPESTALRLRELAARNDTIFCAAAHELKKHGGFFSDRPVYGQPAVTTRWGHPWDTTARIGMMCVSRYENTGRVAYREFLHAAADAYFDTDPGKAKEVSPMTVGHAISLQVAAWRSTAQQRYLQRARYFGDYALKTFFDAPLPRSKPASDRYESIAGADTLALALVELHLNILGITAVRCPPNTSDR